MNKFRFINMHPGGKFTNDCVKRAVALASGRDYKEVSLGLNRYKKVTGAEVFNEDRNWKAYIFNEGFVNTFFPAVAGQKRMNVREFCERFPEGIHILRISKHTTVCVNGVICDTWVNFNRSVYSSYKSPLNLSIEELLKLIPVYWEGIDTKGFQDLKYPTHAEWIEIRTNNKEKNK